MHRILAAGFACAALGYADASLAQQALTKPISVARIVSSIPEGKQWGEIRYSVGCIGQFATLIWGQGRRGNLNVRGFEQPARIALKNQGFNVSGDLSSPFGEEASSDLAIGATMTAIRGDFCLGLLENSQNSMMGSVAMELDWQIYSNSERRVLVTVHTRGGSQSTTSQTGGFESLLIAALDDNLRAFTASDKFKTIINAGPTGAPTPSQAKTPLPLAGSLAAKPMKISDAVGSVVLILAGGGHGSGFLISSDGYLMTAEHVVGADRTVKIRWSDGLETSGEVIRSDRRRDVALIKADPRGRSPLALRREAPQPGDTVFAIGAPIKLELQSTVTRGVASANRIMDGFSFIQSDVTVDPGNSGGPLLNEKGEVLGFTDIGIRTADAPTGLNFFVPIRDALDFLTLEQR